MPALIGAGLAFLVIGAATPAAAHGGLAGEFTTAATWTDDLGVILPLYASAGLYLVGLRRLWRRAGIGRGIRFWQAGCFWAGWVVLALALLSPLHWLSERLFVAHMVEHEVMMLIAAPLFVVARPIGAWLWAVPQAARRAAGRLARQGWFARLWRAATHPAGASGLHAAALWGWHIPGAFTAALDHPALHWLQHLSFLASALLFWWALLQGRDRAHAAGAGVLWLFLTAMHSSALGILLTLSRSPWIPLQSAIAGDWGLTPLEDQQLAGLVMWVPAGIVYTAVALALAGRWIATSSARAPRPADAWGGIHG